MKLIFVNSTKGHRTSVYELANELNKKNYDIMILQPSSSLQKMEFVTEKKINEGIKVKTFGAFFLPKIRYTIPNFFSQMNMLSTLVKEGYDIVQVSDYFYPTVFPPIILKKLKKMPLIIASNTIVGTDWKYGSKFVDLVGRVYTETFSKCIFNSADKLVFLYRQLSEIVKNIGILEEKIEIIPNGVDINKFYPRDRQRMREKLDIDLESKIILSVGRLVPVKGIEMLIEITRELIKESPEIKTYYIGDGPYKKYYESLAEDIKDNFVFLGRRSHEKIPEYLSATDVFVLPSLSEGLPSSLLEAGACGVPVVASSVGGIPEIIEPEKTGYLASEKKEFVFYIKKILENRFNRKKIRKKISEKYSWKKIVKKYEKIYESLI